MRISSRCVFARGRLLEFLILVQCALPVFEGLFPPPYDKSVADLLFVFTYWHGVCKLRMHTDSTIELLEDLTRQFGSLIQRFAADTSEIPTVELPKEADARRRRKAAGTASENQPTSSKPKKLNLSTYKFHAMGDYPQSNPIFWDHRLNFHTTGMYTAKL